MPPPDCADQKSASGNSAADRLFFGGFILALLLLAFLAGALLSTARIFPGPQIAQAYEAGRALYTQATAYDDPFAGDLWFPIRREEAGLVLKDGERMQEGLTLYASGEQTVARLLSAEGDVLHQWHLPFSEILGEGSRIHNPRPDPFVYFRNAHLYPDGSLLVVIEGNGDTPYGYAIAKLSADSELLWLYDGGAHHDLEVGPDGRIYALTHEVVQHRLKHFDNLADAWLEDYLVVLSPEGEEELKLPLTEMVARSSYSHLLHTVSSYSVADPLHTNAVNFVGSAFAARHSFAEEGDLLLSFRELNAVGIVRPERGELVWATRGPWVGQHDADPLPNGNILLFDNYADYQGDSGISRVIEFDPQSMKIVWSYGGTSEQPLDSAIRSEQQRLDNGNTLIVESNGGRILEVSPDGEIVWEFINPARGGEKQDQVAIIASARRLSPQTLNSNFLAQLPLSEAGAIQEAKETSKP